MDTDSDSFSETDDESYCDSVSGESYDASENGQLQLDSQNDELYGQDDEPTLKTSPRSLVSLCAVQCVVRGSVAQLTRQQLPPTLYPTLLAEACRVRSCDMVSHLVASWPFPLLNLNTLDVPLDAMGCFFTKAWGSDSLSLASMIIKGLLELEPGTRLRQVVLPHSQCKGSEMLRVFCQLQLQLLRHIPTPHLGRMIRKQLKLDIGLTHYLQSLPRPPFPCSKKRRHKHTEPLTIVLPGVVQSLGRHCNYRDLLLGLALQAYTHVEFAFEKLAFHNTVQPALFEQTLNLCKQPETTRKLVFSSRKSQCGHVVLTLATLRQSLSRFSRVEVFSCCKSGGLQPAARLQMAVEQAGGCLAGWAALRELNVSENRLSGTLGALLGGLRSPLVKLNVSGTALEPTDLHFLAASRLHTAALQYLNLDYIDLSAPGALAAAQELFRALRALVYLRTCATRLSCAEAESLATCLQHLDTLRHWNLKQNAFGVIGELSRLLEVAARIRSLRELGCKPFELHALFANVYVSSVGPPALSDSERAQLAAQADKHNIVVY